MKKYRNILKYGKAEFPLEKQIKIYKNVSKIQKH